MAPNLLVLGGSTEARHLAAALVREGVDARLSLAGRVAAPREQPLPVRIGGFGGVCGLQTYLETHEITHLVDATHPFAAGMSRNAVAAAARAKVPLAALTRPPWTPGDGDRWEQVADTAAAVAALSGPGKRVFLALGRMTLASFAAQPQHHYLLRLIDPPETPLPLPRHEVLIARGPFTLGAERDLLRDRGVDLVVCKNSGGAATRAKLDAARELGLPALMIDRPALPPRTEFHDVGRVLEWIADPT